MKKLSCVIIETRPLPDLVKIINNHLKFLPKDVDLFIFHSHQNAYLKKLFPQAKFTQLSGEMNEYYYNFLLTSPAFWERFLEYDKVLIFQHDSMILRPGIEEFMEMDYGYIGAPIWHTLNAYNGGLSLRDPKLMYEICSTHNWEAINEDMWYCKIILDKYPNRLAPKEVCSKFSVESIFELLALGGHAISKYLTPEQCEKILHQYD